MNSISGVAASIKSAIASQIGLSFEIAIKSLQQALSENPDGQPQVVVGHRLFNLWNEIDGEIRKEIERDANHAFHHWFPEWVTLRNKDANKQKLLPSIDRWFEKHEAFFDLVSTRYDLPDQETNRWKSDHLFTRTSVLHKSPSLFPVSVCVDGNKKDDHYDGIGVLVVFWYAIMSKALVLRWSDTACEKNKGLAKDRDDIKDYIVRSVRQILGDINITPWEDMHKEKLQKFGY